MNDSVRCLFRIGYSLTVLVGGALWLCSTSGGQEYLEVKPLKGTDDSTFRTLQSGKFDPPLTQEHKRIINDAAKWFTYRLTWPDSLLDKKTLANVVNEASNQMVFQSDPAKPLPAAQQEYMKEFGKAMVLHLSKVMQSDRIATQINGARILALLGKAGQDEIIDLSVRVLKDENASDAVKLWVAHGLHDLFALKRPDPKKEKPAIQALLAYLIKQSSRKDLPESEADGLRFVRREVIRTLGETRFPAVVNLPKVDPTAWWLLRVVRKDRITPEPSLSEQIEAAIGVCQLDPALTKEFNTDYVAQHLGAFIVEFAGHSNNRLNLAPPNNGASIAWKAQAARLTQALDQLAKNAPKDRYVEQMVLQAKRVLAPLVAKDSPPVAEPLQSWLQQNKPKSSVVIQIVPDSSIKAPAADGK